MGLSSLGARDGNWSMRSSRERTVAEDGEFASCRREERCAIYCGCSPGITDAMNAARYATGSRSQNRASRQMQRLLSMLMRCFPHLRRLMA